MLAAFRAFAKSPWAIGLIGLLIFAFAAVGLTDAFRPNIGDSVIKVGSRTVTANEFRVAYDRYRKNMEQQYGQPISPELAMEQGLDKQVVKMMADGDTFSELLVKLGLRAPDSLINERIRQEQAFFDPITGAFDQKKFEQVLAENNLTPETYKRGLGDDLLQAQLVPAAAGGLRAPRAYSTLGGALMLEQRDLAYFAIAPGSVPQPAMPTEAELAAFLKANGRPLPEFRGFSVVRLSRKSMIPTVSVDPAEVQKRFDFEKDSLSKAEARTVVQIPLKDAGQAPAVAARLSKGENPAVVAGSLGIKPIVSADKPRSAFFDAAVRDAAFKLPAGGVTTVKGEFGTVVVKVETITAGKEATISEHRADIEAKVRNEAADRKISAASKVYEEAHNAGANMADAAAKAGLPVTTVAPVSAQGLGQDGKPAAGLSPAVLKAAFEMGQGVDGEIVQEAEGEYFIVRVDRIVAPALPPMEEIRPTLIRAMMMRRVSEQMQKKAEGLVARVRKGESIDAVAASAGAQVVRLNGVSAATAKQYEALGRELLGGAFQAKKGEVFTAGGANGALLVATVSAIRPGDVNQIAMAANQQEVSFSEQLFKDIRESMLVYATAKLKTETNIRNARIAIGIDAAKAGDAAGKPVAAPAAKGK